MKKSMKKPISILVIMAMLLTMIPSVAFATTVPDDGVDKEWYNFRNNQENNGVTDRNAPTELSETWLRFGEKYGTGWSAAPTPPIILDGYLYIASGLNVLKIDKETGKVVAKSDDMKANPGFAMNPILYADGKLFVQVGNGIVQAIDYKTLKCVWQTEKISGQTVSPLSYVNIDGKGYIYTGTWTNEKRDGTFFCFTTDDENLEPEMSNDKDPKPTGRMVKKDLWKFVPKVNDEILAKDETANGRGFYWAGAYATEKYIAVGSDDGAREPSPDQINLPEYHKGVFYTLNPLTGEIIDRIDGIQGDIRSTVVFDNGYLYFNTKGGIIFKVKVNEDGTFDHDDIQSYDLGGMTTGTPIVYKNKIYLGVAGKGGQFDPDAGHRFAVISNKGKLEEIYSLPVPGYPQAGALLSTAHEQEDFDGDGEADGRVYIYFTYNANPGGIFATYDTPDGKNIPKKGVEIFIPPKEMQQYCISTIIADREGTLYYKNDSCNLMAVEINTANLDGIEISAGKEKSVMTPTFDTRTSSYEAVVKTTDEVSVNLNVPKNVEVKVNGISYTPGMKVKTPNENTEIKIETSKGDKKRVYTVNVRKQSENALLGSVYVNASNNASSGKIQVTPELSPDVFEYTADITNVEPLVGKLYNIWPQTADKTSTMEVTAGDNVKEIDKISPRYAIYPKDTGKTCSVNIKVTSETGNTVNNYKIILMKKIPVNGVEIKDGDKTVTDEDNLTMNVGEKKTFKAHVLPEDASIKDVTWSVYPDDKADINTSTGEVTAKAPGEITLGVTTKDKSKTATVKINIVEPVVPVTGVSITKKETALNVDDEFTFEASVLPETATNKELKWSVDDTDIAEINPLTGKLKAKAPGVVKVTVSTKDGNKKETCQVTISAKVINVDSVEIKGGNKVINVDDEINLEATVLPELATNKDIIWSVDDNKLASINAETGKLTALKAGVVKVTATSEDGEKTDEITVTINKKIVNVEKIEIKELTEKILEGQKVVLKAELLPEDATNKEITWSVDNEELAKIDAVTGELTALKAGTVKVTAKSESADIKAEYEIVIEPRVVISTGLEILGGDLELKVNNKITLEAVVTPEDVTDKNVTWSVDNEELATIDAITGELTALKAGTVKVIAKANDNGAEATIELVIKDDEKPAPVDPEIKPGETEHVEKPLQPAKPETGKHVEKAEKPANPKTGDENSMYPWMILLLGAGLTTMVIRRKNNK